MALSKERKNEVLSLYEKWLKESEALLMAEYTGLNMTQINELRSNIRNAGGEFHVVKNTLGKRAFINAGLEPPEDYFTGSTAFGIAFDDPPGIAKIIKDFGRIHDVVKLKAGFIDGQFLDAVAVNAFAELPPLPVVRSQLLGVINAPASKLARTLAEPGRSLAQVIKAHTDAAPV